MCGIVGALDLRGRRAFPPDVLERMARAIAHRGPDDQQAHFEPGLALGVRRLAIVDVAGGRQPISNETGDVWVACNGELFDHAELRQGLRARGHVLATRCDTELWAHLYEERGHDVFEQARGQFAVAIWDRRERRLLLGRDRVGICPLHYTEHDGWLLFASEIRALLATGWVAARPDARAIDHLFTFFCGGTTRTFFEGIHSIAPASYLEAKHGDVRTRAYWDIDFPDDGDEITAPDPQRLVDELEAHVERAIRRRLSGDVPVVAYVSGGLDSTLVLGMAGKVAGSPVPSFTVGLDGAGPDERAKARETASLLGSPLTTVTMSARDVANAFPAGVLAAEGPIVDTSNACLLRLAQEVRRQGFKVALTGEGADEAFAGYVWFKSQKAFRALERYGAAAVPWAIRGALLAMLGGGSRRLPHHATQGVRTAQQDVHDPLGQARHFFFRRELWEKIGDHCPYDDVDLAHPRLRKWHPLNQSLYMEYKLMLPGHLLLGKGDRVSMGASVEARYPFLDEDLVTFASTLSPSYKLRFFREKWLLRKLAERTLPPRIAGRPKSMFRAYRAPIFFSGERPAWVDELLSEASLRATGLFDPKAVAQEIEHQRALPVVTPRRVTFDATLMAVLSTQLFHHLYCGGGLSSLPRWSAP